VLVLVLVLVLENPVRPKSAERSTSRPVEHEHRFAEHEYEYGTYNGYLWLATHNPISNSERDHEARKAW
jgi:hypothetical protein